MVKHRRYPHRKQKGSFVDPGNKTPLGNKKNRHNLEPTVDMLDYQPVPRKVKEMSRRTKLVEELQTGKRKPKFKNRFLEETSKLGYAQKPWESAEVMLGRINRDSWKSVGDELLKAKYGMAGRDAKEIAGDYKELDEKTKRHKLQKMARREKLKKLKEKEIRFKADQKQKRGRRNSDSDDQLFEDGQEANENNANMEVDSSGEESVGDDRPVERKLTTPRIFSKPQEPKEDGAVKKKQRLSKKEKVRLKKKDEREETDKYMLLNAREIIPFGERADAPPVFSAKIRQIMDPLSAQAGKKDLLLKEKFLPKSAASPTKRWTSIKPKRSNANDEPMSSKPKPPKRTNANHEPLGKPRKMTVDAKEREQVINAYRKRPRTEGVANSNS